MRVLWTRAYRAIFGLLGCGRSGPEPETLNGLGFRV